MTQQTSAVLLEVKQERARQDVTWGEQNHPSFTSNQALMFPAVAMKIENEDAIRAGRLSWEHILLEEVAEAMEERTDTVRLREELVQVAAVAAAWIECIDRHNGATR